MMRFQSTGHLGLRARLMGAALMCLALTACGPDEAAPNPEPVTPNEAGCAPWSTGFGCDDGDPCTVQDRCIGSVCKGTAVDCDDGNPCTVGACDATGECHVEVVTGSCDDDDPCTKGDACVDGVCSGEPNLCDDGESCTADSCVRPFGCIHQPLQSLCDDQNPCTLHDQCVQGACEGTLAADCDQPWCGDGVCQTSETCEACPSDCSPAGLGVCSSSCDPTAESPCSDNFACVPTTDGALNPQSFLTYTGRCGVGCAGDEDCSGGVCVMVEGLETTGLCQDPCEPDDEAACGAGRACVPLDGAGTGPAGVCSMWSACEPGEGCGPGEAGACLGLPDHPSQGLCSMGCWAAWDGTCPESLGSCVALAAPDLHEGVCVGEETACDLAGQTDCPGGHTCTPLVGLALGGTARVCVPAPGDAGVGSACEPEGCAEGLLCYEGACRVSCDPGQGCAEGTCVIPDIWELTLGAIAGVCVDPCGDGVCGAGESCSSCSSDCGACVQCGDGVCSGSEHCVTCPVDCGVCPMCGDGLCQGGESCGSCPGDCGACICGDGSCQAPETCGGCEVDCPACECGDGQCVAGESCSTCEADCGACACGDGVCDGEETCQDCQADCGPCWCGDGLCSGAEDCGSCAMDCGSCVCGDAVCQTVESCAACPEDCGTCEVNCGDGLCAHLENCATCAQDCGACPEICGDGLCVTGENCESCPSDCCPQCGDGICHGAETCTSCPSDCSLLAVGSCNGTCDPTEGAQACSGNYACVPSKSGSETLLPAAAGHGVCVHNPCSQDSDCAQGTCLLLDGLESAGTCGVPCTVGDTEGCGAWEICLALDGEDAAEGAPGVCRPERSCESPVEQFCSLAGASACVALPEFDVGACMKGCFLDDPSACSGGGACVAKTRAQWHEGTCVGQETPCDPIGQTGCGPSETCRALGGASYGGTSYLCVETSGQGQEGASCGADTDCSVGLPCVFGACRVLCDPGVGCASGSCQAVGSLFSLAPDALGVCLGGP